MQNKLTTALWSILLLSLGGIGLLYNFGLLDPYKVASAYIVAALLALTGVAFLVLIVFQQDRWLFVVPGSSFLTLGAVVYLSTLGTIAPVWLGALFLLGIALGFLLLFISNRSERWWALLQTGTIAVVALVGLGIGVPKEAEHLIGAALFGGFALSFLLLYLFAGNHRRFLWALIMAGVLAIFAATLLVAGYGERSLVVRLWPVILMLLGGYLLVRVMTGRTARPQPVAPVVPIEKVEQPAIPTPVQSGEPARIVREGQPAPQDAPATDTPAPTPDPTPDTQNSAPLPETIGDINPQEDPAAALDALLAASQEADDSEPPDA